MVARVARLVDDVVGQRHKGIDGLFDSLMLIGGPLWSPAVAPCLAWTSQRLPVPRRGSPPMGGLQGPNLTQLLSHPYARPVAFTAKSTMPQKRLSPFWLRFVNIKDRTCTSREASQERV